MNPIAAFDQLLGILESQGHLFDTYEEFELYVARTTDELEDTELLIGAAQAS